jgi:uncharacterized protein YndB with AHSA1/START domain
MSGRFTEHDTFVIERTFPVPRSRVFAAWAEPDAKAQWFGFDEKGGDEFDFRVGGREVVRGGPDGGPVFTFRGIYQDIVPDERIVYTYDMLMDDQRISVSVATVEFKPAGDDTLLVFTEQGVFLDGLDEASRRKEGTGTLLDKLEAALRGEPART